jgi:hypothetical protein
VQKLSVTSGAFEYVLGDYVYSRRPKILLFPALKEVTVCSTITGFTYRQQDGKLHLKSHLGKCISASDVSSCFPKNSNLTLIPGNGVHPVSNINESFFRPKKSFVDDFLHNLRSGK